MQMVNSNQEVKSDSLWRALKLLLYIPLDNELRCSIAFLILRVKNWQVRMMLDMNSKRNKSKNTSASNWNRVRVREKAVVNTRELFRGSSIKLYVPAFTAWRILLSTKDLFTKKPSQRYYKVYTRSEYTTLTLNPLHKRSQSQWSL